MRNRDCNPIRLRCRGGTALSLHCAVYNVRQRAPAGNSLPLSRRSPTDIQRAAIEILPLGSFKEGQVPTISIAHPHRRAIAPSVPHSAVLRDTFLMFGIGSSPLYIVANVMVPMQSPGYSVA